MRYLIVTHMRKADGKYNEAIHLDTTLKPKVLQTASVILDYKEQKVVKMRFDGMMEDRRNFTKISNFFRGHYPDVISKLEAKYEILNDVQDLIAEAIENGDQVALTTDDVKQLSEDDAK